MEQALRFVPSEDLSLFFQALREAQVKAGSSSFEWPIDMLPFTICITSIAKLSVSRGGNV